MYQFLKNPAIPIGSEAFIESVWQGYGNVYISYLAPPLAEGKTAPVGRSFEEKK
ncbi:hypothetical protein IR148_12460 [Dysgonomonas mossii]|uniref:hypothetical protein n=1 Tax=Dysgonomonas mossii TaxID=163665 RepID=UPI001430B330|nr:hypothetical protein [Dysgonomonas mossii]MBF0761852.1 hypothetical protein [Dysgonomonas mossii]